MQVRSLFNSVKSEFWRQTASHLPKWRTFIHLFIGPSILQSEHFFLDRAVFPAPSYLSFLSLNSVHSVRTVHGWSCQDFLFFFFSFLFWVITAVLLLHFCALVTRMESFVERFDFRVKHFVLKTEWEIREGIKLDVYKSLSLTEAWSPRHGKITWSELRTDQK